jgi:hypothetical protein
LFSPWSGFIAPDREALGYTRCAGHVWVVEGGTRTIRGGITTSRDAQAIAAQWGVAAVGSVAYQNVERITRTDEAPAGVGAEISRLGQAPAIVAPPDPAQPLRGRRRPGLLAIGEQIACATPSRLSAELKSRGSGGDPCYS